MRSFFQFFLVATLLSAQSCRLPDNFGFFQPITLSLAVPDGPPEYKAGWYSGCKSGLGARANGAFANAGSYQDGKGPEFVSGIYMHDPAYQTGWGQGWFSCSVHAGSFVMSNSMAIAPLQ